jgi:hypothetical protein
MLPELHTAAEASLARRLQSNISYEQACLSAPSVCNALATRWDEYGGRASYEEVNPFYNEKMTPEDAKNASMIAGGIFGGLALLVLLVFCCMHHAINVAVAVVKSACDCMFAMPCLLVMPFIELVIKMITFSVLLYLFTWVVSSGHMDTKTLADIGGVEVNGLRRKFEYDEEQKGYIAYFVFGIFWFLELANAMGSFVISYTVVGWYYTPKGSNGSKGHNWFGVCTGYCYACTYHLGTLAMGSFLIALLRFIRLIAMIVEKQAKGEGNVVVACIAKIVICCVSCMKKCVELINKNAYIDVAISSSNFCQAAQHVMSFLVGNAPEIAILNGACFIFSMTGIGVIAGSTSYTTYMLCTTQERWTDPASDHHVESPRVVAAVVFVGSSFIAHAFMNIFDHTADTLLYTYVWNKVHANNTVPKYAPQALMDLCEFKAMEKPKGGGGGKPQGGGGGGGGFFSSLFGSKKDGNAETDPLINK